MLFFEWERDTRDPGLAGPFLQESCWLRGGRHGAIHVLLSSPVDRRALAQAGRAMCPKRPPVSMVGVSCLFLGPQLGS